MKTTLIGMFFLLFGGLVFSQQMKESIWFATADDHLSPTSRLSLDKISALAKNHPIIRIEIPGNTKNPETPDHKIEAS